MTRENSGQGEGTTNMRDPTVRDHEGEGGPGTRTGDFTEGADENAIAGNVAEHGETASPSDRSRGETSAADAARPIDQNR